MQDYLWLNLQLFADGGDGGDGGSATADGDSGDPVLDSIPERARKFYKPASTPKSAPKEQTEEQTTDEPKPTKMSYADIIKSDDYKDEHKAYMEKTIGDRLKKYKGMEETNSKMRNALEAVATKYGIDASSESFLDDLSAKIEADDSFYEQYAVDHDITPAEARKVVTMERKLADVERQKEEAERQRKVEEHLITLRQNAEKTKAQFPNFDLDAEMADPRFRQLCISTNGDTTASYMALHWNDVMTNAVSVATSKAKEQTAKAIASNQGRPTENGTSSNASAVVTVDYSKMNLQQLREQAQRWALEKR